MFPRKICELRQSKKLERDGQIVSEPFRDQKGTEKYSVPEIEEEEEIINIRSLQSDSSLRVKCSINNITLHAVVDTAADKTIISKETFNSLKIKDSTLNMVKMQAAGEDQVIMARKIGPVQIRIGNGIFYKFIYVAPILDRMLIGMDMLKDMEAKIDIKEKTLCCKAEILPLQDANRLWDRGKEEQIPAILKENVRLSPESETVVPIQMEGLHIKRTMFLEPYQNLSVLIARALYKDTANPIVSFINTTKKTIHLKKGIRIGTFHNVEDSDISQNDPKVRRLTRPDTADTAPDHSSLPEKLEQVWKEGSNLLNEEESIKLRDALIEFQDVFAESDYDLGNFDAIHHQIDTGDARPIKLGLRRTPLHFCTEEEKLIKKMLDANIIRPSTSAWAAAPVLVKKKTGEFRYCLDYRALNKVTEKDTYPIPLIGECIDALSGSIWFSKLDANQAYYQVPIHPDSKQKTAFRTKHGLYEFNVMSFGLANAPSTFSRVMALVLKGLNWDTVLSFLDDLCVVGSSFENHLQNLKAVFSRFQDYGLKLKPKKSELFREEVEFLGRKVGKHGVTLADHSIDTIKSWNPPKTFKEMQQFLGFVNYHHNFIANFASICEPFHQILKTKKFIWGKPHQEAFDQLKDKLSSPPILSIPTKEGHFFLDTDASNFAIGAALLQEQDDQLVTIGYSSFTLSTQQRKYCTTRRELLAVIRFCGHFKHYLLGRKFTLRTDHHSLIWLLNFKNLEGQLARWMEELSRFSMNLKHRPGKFHENADYLSRPTGEEICPELEDLPCGGCSHCKKIEEKWKVFGETVDDSLDLASSHLNIRQVSETKLEISWPRQDILQIRQA